MKKACSVIAFAIAAAFAVAVSAQQQAAPTGVKNYKFQSTSPASLTLQDNFKMFAERVDKLTGGRRADRESAGSGKRAAFGGRPVSQKRRGPPPPATPYDLAPQC